jgi:biotin-(acetyl-CoA carboxylase) ligase
VNETILEHPENLHNHLTTMFEISNHAHQRELIVAEFINSIEHQLYYISSDPKKIINEWLGNCIHLDEKICFFENGEIIEGIFRGLDENGLAKIDVQNEIKTYSSINII